MTEFTNPVAAPLRQSRAGEPLENIAANIRFFERQIRDEVRLASLHGIPLSAFNGLATIANDLLARLTARAAATTGEPVESSAKILGAAIRRLEIGIAGGGTWLTAARCQAVLATIAGLMAPAPQVAALTETPSSNHEAATDALQSGRQSDPGDAGRTPAGAMSWEERRLEVLRTCADFSDRRIKELESKVAALTEERDGWRDEALKQGEAFAASQRGLRHSEEIRASLSAALEGITERSSYPIDPRDAFEEALDRARAALPSGDAPR